MIQFTVLCQFEGHEDTEGFMKVQTIETLLFGEYTIIFR
jgi:hypothetical protein